MGQLDELQQRLLTEIHLTSGRIRHIRAFCQTTVDAEGELSNRGWACQTVLNILDGKIDEQIQEEIRRDADQVRADGGPGDGEVLHR